MRKKFLLTSNTKFYMGLPKDRNPQFRCIGMWILHRPKCCGPQDNNT